MKTNNQLFYELSTGPIAILPGYLESFLLNMTAEIGGSVSIEKMGVQAATASTGGKIMIIPIKGVITTNSYPEYGIFGMRDVQNALETAKNDSEILGVILHIKSPGGNMSLVAETADMIFGFTKPIQAFCEELVASSAYYLAAATDKITVTPRSTIVGNVGSKISYMDTNGIWEKMGAKFIEVYGSKAINKDLGHTDAKAGKPEKLRNILIDPANEMFIQDVLKYRPQLKASQLDGMVWYSEDAVKYKFADATGTLQEVINSFNFSNNHTKNTMGQLVKLTFEEGTMAHAFAKTIAVKEESNQTDAAATTVTPPVETTPASPPAAAVTATAPVAEANPAPSSIEARLSALEATIKEKNTTIATLQTQLGAALTTNPAAARSESQQEAQDPKAGVTEPIEIDGDAWRTAEAAYRESLGYPIQAKK